MKYVINFIIIILFLFALKFFSFTGITPTAYGNAFKIILLLLLGYLAVTWSETNSYRGNYASFKHVLVFCIWPVLTAVSCYVGNGQSVTESLNTCFMHSILFIYFFCVLFDIDKSFLIKLIIVLALVRTGLSLVQQFTYPNVWFTMRSGLWNAETHKYTEDIRSGIYRFLIADAYYLPMFMGFYSFAKILKGEYSRYVVLFIIAFIGLYLDQSRQVLASYIGTLFFVPFLSNGSKYKYTVIVAIIAIVLYSNFSLLFGDLQEHTSDEISDSYIRFVSYSYYWNNMGDIITTLFGNGFPGNSAYGNQIIKLQESGLWRVDIGIVGTMHLMGVGFVIAFLYYYWDIIRRYWNSIDMTLKFMYVSIIFQLPLILPLYNTSLPGYECFMGILFYLTDMSIFEHEEEALAEEEEDNMYIEDDPEDFFITEEV